MGTTVRKTPAVEVLDHPLSRGTRLVLLGLVAVLLLSFAFPLWRISMTAPQYPDGLYLDIFSYRISGGNEGQHIQEINTLNHYIGMQKLDRSMLNDLDWLPFAFGILALLALRVLLLGNVRDLVDVTVLSMYVLTFALARFVYVLWSYGHNLAPDAPVKVAPFTPAIFGTKDIANFTVTSLPRAGALFMGLFGAGLVLLLLREWRLQRRRAAGA